MPDWQILVIYTFQSLLHSHYSVFQIKPPNKPQFNGKNQRLTKRLDDEGIKDKSKKKKRKKAQKREEKRRKKICRVFDSSHMAEHINILTNVCLILSKLGTFAYPLTPPPRPPLSLTTKTVDVFCIYFPFNISGA